MKKHMVWIVIALFMLTACSATPDSTEAEAPIPGINAEKNYPTFFDINDYNQFIATSKWIPDVFLSWEKVATLGEFEAFGLTGNDKYWYGIGDGNGWVTLLYIDHTPDGDPLDEKYPDIEMPKDMISMRTGKRSGTSETIKSCEIIRNGFKYCYDMNGDLLSITWYVNGIEFCLGGGDLTSYPETGPQTGIGRLLSVSDEDFNSAVAELKRNLN